MVLELFFIIPYLTSRAMKNQQEQKTREEAYAEALKRYQARVAKMMSEGMTQEEAEQVLLEERQRRLERLQKLMEDGMTQEEALQVLAEERRQQEEQEKAEEEQKKEQTKEEDPPSTPELDEDASSTDEEEVEKELYAMMVGRRVNENGQIVDKRTGIVLGEVVEGRLKRLIGKKVKENGEIYSSKGKLIGRAEPVLYRSEGEDSSEEEEEEKKTREKSPKQNFPIIHKSGQVMDKDNHVVGYVEKHIATQFEGCLIDANGNILDQNKQIQGQAHMVGPVNDSSPKVTPTGDVTDMNAKVIGQVEKELAIKWDGYKVGENGLVIDTDGNVVGKAIMYPDTPDSHMPTVRKSGKVMDEDDNIVGHVDKSIARQFAGYSVDARGNILDPQGQSVGKANLIALEHERCIELSDQIAIMIDPYMDKIKPVLVSIADCVNTEEANRHQEALENQLKPKIDEATHILKDLLQTIGKLDPSMYQSVCNQKFKGEASSEEYELAKRIADTIKEKAFEREASPEECNLADSLAYLAADTATTMKRTKKKLKSMSFVSRDISSSWEELKSVLLQITAFTGLLLPTVLWIAGNLLNNRGHGAVIRLLLGGLGLKKLLMRFGLANALKIN